MGISDIFSDIKDDINSKIMLNTFKKYLESQKIKYEVKEGFVHFEVQLDNRLKSVKFKMLFSGALVYVTVTIIDSTPREFGLAIERYLELMNQKNIGTEGKYTYYPEFDGPIVLTSDKYYWEGDRDDFLKECLDVPLKILEADGDSLYEFIHSLEDGSSSAIVGLGEVPKKGEAKENEEEADGSLAAKVSAAFADYLKRQDAPFQVEPDGDIVLDVPLDNMLRTISLDIDFYDYGVCGSSVVATTIPKRAEKKVKDYLEKLNRRSKDVNFQFLRLDPPLANMIMLDFYVDFDGLEEITDDFIHRCLSAPIDILKLYDAINSETNTVEEDEGEGENGPASLAPFVPPGREERPDDSVEENQVRGTRRSAMMYGDGEEAVDAPAASADSGSSEEGCQDEGAENPPAEEQGTTVPEAVEMVKGWMDEKGYSYKVKDGEVPQLEASFRLFRVNGKVEVIGLFFYFYKTGLLVHATICDHFVPEGNRDRMAIELNQWNFGNVFRGSYEMKNSNGAMTYRYSIEYGESIRLPQGTLDRGIRACVHAWDEVPENILRLMEDSQTTSENTTDPPSGKSEKGGKDASAKDGSVGSGQAEPQGTSIPEAMAMVKNWLERVGFKQRTVEEGENPRIGLTVHTCAPKRIEYIVINFFFYEFGMMVTTTVKGHAVPQEDRKRMSAALNDWNYRKMQVGNYEMSNQTGGVNFRFFIYYSDKIKLTQEMVDKVSWLADGAWDKPPEEVLKLLRVPERAGD